MSQGQAPTPGAGASSTDRDQASVEDVKLEKRVPLEEPVAGIPAFPAEPRGNRPSDLESHAPATLPRQQKRHLNIEQAPNWADASPRRRLPWMWIALACIAAILIGALVATAIVLTRQGDKEETRDSSTGPARIIVLFDDPSTRIAQALPPILIPFIREQQRLNRTGLEVVDFVDEDVYQKAYQELSKRTDVLSVLRSQWFESDNMEKPVLVTNLSSPANNTRHRRLQEVVPNDQALVRQWNLPKVGMFDAWDITQGSEDVIVAVMDSGVDYNHPDLAESMWINQAELYGLEGVDDDGNGFIDDIYGFDFGDNDPDPMDGSYHGTFCAGIIAAQSDNLIGIAGVAPKVKIMALKIMDKAGRLEIARAFQAYEYAMQMGAHIVSNSFNTNRYPQGQPTAAPPSYHAQLNIQFARVVDRLAAADILLVASAGNYGVDNDQLKALGYAENPTNQESSNVISVMSSRWNDRPSSFSSYGATTVHIAAPGESIYSLQPDATYGLGSGTSYSAPMVSGAAALVLSYLRTGDSMPQGMTAGAIKDLILSTADPIASMEGLSTSGGRLNVHKLLQASRDRKGVLAFSPVLPLQQAAFVGTNADFWKLPASPAAQQLPAPADPLWQTQPLTSASAIRNFNFQPTTRGIRSFFRYNQGHAVTLTDNFVMRLSAHLKVASAGTYSFAAGANGGMRVLLNGYAILNYDGVHQLSDGPSDVVEVELREAGLYQLEVQYFDSVGMRQALYLQWAKGSDARARRRLSPISRTNMVQVITQSALDERPLSPGLLLQAAPLDASTYANQLPAMPRATEYASVVARVDTASGNSDKRTGAVPEQLRNAYVAKVEGIMLFPAASTYILGVRCSGGCQVFLGGKMIINRDGRLSCGDRTSGTITIPSANTYLPVKVLQYHYRRQDPCFQLQWQQTALQAARGVPSRREAVAEAFLFNEHAVPDPMQLWPGYMQGLSVRMWRLDSSEAEHLDVLLGGHLNEAEMYGQTRIAGSRSLELDLAELFPSLQLQAGDTWAVHLAGFWQPDTLPAALGFSPPAGLAVAQLSGITVSDSRISAPDLAPVQVVQPGSNRFEVWWIARPGDTLTVLWRSVEDEPDALAHTLNTGSGSFSIPMASFDGEDGGPGSFLRVQDIQQPEDLRLFLPVDRERQEVSISEIMEDRGMDLLITPPGSPANQLSTLSGYLNIESDGRYIFLSYHYPGQSSMLRIGGEVLHPAEPAEGVETGRACRYWKGYGGSCTKVGTEYGEVHLKSGRYPLDLSVRTTPLSESAVYMVVYVLRSPAGRSGHLDVNWVTQPPPSQLVASGVRANRTEAAPGLQGAMPQGMDDLGLQVLVPAQQMDLPVP